MEDVFKFLIIAAAVIISIKQQSKKGAKKNTANKPAIPVPEAWPDIEIKEVEVKEGNTYDGYIPETPAPKIVKPKVQNSPKIKPEKTSEPSIRLQSPTLMTESQESEFGFQSIEEVRKAIVWSEILQRKY